MNVRAGGPEEAIVPKILKKTGKIGQKMYFSGKFYLKKWNFRPKSSLTLLKVWDPHTYMLNSLSYSIKSYNNDFARQKIYFQQLVELYIGVSCVTTSFNCWYIIYMLVHYTKWSVTLKIGWRSQILIFFQDIWYGYFYVPIKRVCEVIKQKLQICGFY